MMSGAARKNLPPITPETAEYWAGCKRHELLIQRCVDCGAVQFYPRMLCTHCSHRNMQWLRASGRATLLSFSIVHRPLSQAYAAEVPYVVALVSLEEGPTMMSNIIEWSANRLRIGMQLQVVFEDWPEGVTIAKFRPV